MTDDNIKLDWSELVQHGQNSGLLLQLLKLATAVPEENKCEDKIAGLQKANTENLVVNIINLSNASQDIERIIDDFITELGSIDLTILEAESLARLFAVDRPDLIISKIINTPNIAIDWLKVIDEDGHTLLHHLGHMFGGRFETEAQKIYGDHSADPGWQDVNHEMLPGHIGDLFGDFKPLEDLLN